MTNTAEAISLDEWRKDFSALVQQPDFDGVTTLQEYINAMLTIEDQQGWYKAVPTLSTLNCVHVLREMFGRENVVHTTTPHDDPRILFRLRTGEFVLLHVTKNDLYNALLWSLPL